MGTNEVSWALENLLVDVYNSNVSGESSFRTDRRRCCAVERRAALEGNVAANMCEVSVRKKTRSREVGMI